MTHHANILSFVDAERTVRRRHVELNRNNNVRAENTRVERAFDSESSQVNNSFAHDVERRDVARGSQRSSRVSYPRTRAGLNSLVDDFARAENATSRGERSTQRGAAPRENRASRAQDFSRSEERPGTRFGSRSGARNGARSELRVESHSESHMRDSSARRGVSLTREYAHAVRRTSADVPARREYEPTTRRNRDMSSSRSLDRFEQQHGEYPHRSHNARSSRAQQNMQAENRNQRSIRMPRRQTIDARDMRLDEPAYADMEFDITAGERMQEIRGVRNNRTTYTTRSERSGRGDRDLHARDQRFPDIYRPQDAEQTDVSDVRVSRDAHDAHDAIYEGNEEDAPARGIAALAKKMRKYVADRKFARSGYASDGQGELSGPRAAVTEFKMGSTHRKSMDMQEDGKKASSRVHALRAKALHQSFLSRAFVQRAGVAIVCLGILGACVYGPAKEYYSAMRQKQQVNAEMQAVANRNDTLQSQIDALGTDAGVEQAAHNELGWVASGEHAVTVTNANSASDTSNGAQNITYSVKQGSVAAPSEWYNKILDPLFGVDVSGNA